MKVQQSFKAQQDNASGILYLVGTPIGHLDDMTFRAIRILKEVDLIAAEDTRHTRKLLSHYDIHTRLVSYHEHNKQASGAELIRKLQAGTNIALVSDAGLPVISDPGYDLVKDAVDGGVRVVPIPGANAALSALIASGLDPSRFLFVGFLPKDRKRRHELLTQLQHEQATMLLYEAPHHLLRSLQHMYDVWGERHIVIARELTKMHEEISRGTLREAISHYTTQQVKGECCIVIEGKHQPSMIERQEEQWWILLSLQQHVEHYVDAGYEHKEALRKVATDRRVTRRDVYNALHR